MPDFDFFINYPFITAIFLVFALIKYRDKVIVLFPNPKKKLESLLMAKNNCNQNDQDFINFLESEVEKTTFHLGTGLQLNPKNKKLRQLYLDIKDEMEWHEILKIKEYLWNLNSLKEVGTFRAKAMFYVRGFIWFSCFMISLFFLVYWLIKKQGSFNIESFDILLGIVFMISGSVLFFMGELFNVNLIKKFDHIVMNKQIIKSKTIDLSEENSSLADIA